MIWRRTYGGRIRHAWAEVIGKNRVFDLCDANGIIDADRLRGPEQERPKCKECERRADRNREGKA
jgi:hypothetical protein